MEYNRRDLFWELFQWTGYLRLFSTQSKRLLIFRNLTLNYTTSSLRVDIKDEYFSQKDFTMENFQSLLPRVNRLQSALDNWINNSFNHYADSWSELPSNLRTVLVDWQTTQSPSGDLSVDSYAVVAAAAALLSLVFLYVTGHADRGGSKAYSSGCLDFRDTFIAIILFHGAYVWIKSRDVAPKGVYRKLIRDKRGNIIKVVFEPRFKPSHRKGEPSQHIYVGQYGTAEEASIVYQITAFCYHGRGGRLQLGDGNSLTIPPMTESDRRLTGAAKRKCVGAQAREVYKAFKAESANAARPGELQAVGVDQTNSVCSNSAGTTYGAPLSVNPTHNTETGSASCGEEGFGPSLFTNSPNDLVWEPDFVHSLEEGLDAIDAQAFTVSSTYQEGVAAFNSQSGMSLSSNNELDILRILVQNQQEMISLQRQQLQELSEARHQQYIEQQHRDIEHQQLKAQLIELRNHQCFQNLGPQGFSIQHFQPFQDQPQVIEQGMRTSQAGVDHSPDELFRYFEIA